MLFWKELQFTREKFTKFYHDSIVQVKIKKNVFILFSEENLALTQLVRQGINSTLAAAYTVGAAPLTPTNVWLQFPVR
jgi:hypothetical protein